MVRKRKVKAKTKTTYRGPLANRYFAVVRFGKAMRARGIRNQTIADTHHREVLRTAKRYVRVHLDGWRPHDPATIDLRAETPKGKLIAQYETYMNEGSGYLRFRAAEV